MPKSFKHNNVKIHTFQMPLKIDIVYTRNHATFWDLNFTLKFENCTICKIQTLGG